MARAEHPGSLGSGGGSYSPHRDCPFSLPLPAATPGCSSCQHLRLCLRSFSAAANGPVAPGRAGRERASMPQPLPQGVSESPSLCATNLSPRGCGRTPVLAALPSRLPSLLPSPPKQTTWVCVFSGALLGSPEPRHGPAPCHVLFIYPAARAPHSGDHRPHVFLPRLFGGGHCVPQHGTTIVVLQQASCPSAWCDLPGTPPRARGPRRGSLRPWK